MSTDGRRGRAVQDHPAPGCPGRYRDAMTEPDRPADPVLPVRPAISCSSSYWCPSATSTGPRPFTPNGPGLEWTSPCGPPVTDHLTSLLPPGATAGSPWPSRGSSRSSWFGWGQAAPPSWLVVPLAVGAAGLAVLLTVAGVVLTTRVGRAVAGHGRPRGPPPVQHRRGPGVRPARRRRGRARNDRAGPVDPGVDLRRRRRAFLPARLDPGESATAPSTVTGAGAGLCLLAFGLVTLLAGRPLYGDPSDGLRLPRSQPEGKA